MIEIAQDHLGHGPEARLQGCLVEQVAIEHHRQGVPVGHVGEAQGRDADVEVGRIDAGPEFPGRHAAVQNALQLCDDRRVQLGDIVRLLERSGFVQVLVVDHPHEGRVGDVIAERELDQADDGVARRQRIEIDCRFAFTDAGIDLFENGDIETFLAAEIMEDHRFVAVGAGNDAVGASAAETLGRELDKGRVDQFLAAAFRCALARLHSPLRTLGFQGGIALAVLPRGRSRAHQYSLAPISRSQAPAGVPVAPLPNRPCRMMSSVGRPAA